MPIGRNGTDFIVNMTPTATQTLPSVAGLADGRLVVTWSSDDSTDIHARVYNADGMPNGNDFTVNSTQMGIQYAPSVTALADGRFVVTWESGDTGDGSGACIRARVFTANGSQDVFVNDGADFIVNSTAMNSQRNSSVTALANGGFAVTWESDDTGDGSTSCIRGRVFDADGSPASNGGGDFVVNTTTMGYQSKPSVTALSNGGYVVAWESDDTGDGSVGCIRARLYNASGRAIGNDVIVNTTPGSSTTAADQFAASITARPQGGFIVTWSSIDAGDGGTGFCIRGRIFDARGQALGSDFVVNTTGAANQTTPEVTALADGRFVVTWASFDPADGSGSCIRARLYNADGQAAGNDFVVNTVGFDNQVAPEVTALADGRFVITWQSADLGDSSGGCIRAQTFDPRVFVGTGGDDVWSGSDLFADTITGNANHDRLLGLGGDDVISGDSGQDWLTGGNGNDKLFGGAHYDYLEGSAGNDLLYGGSDDDVLLGDLGNDLLCGDIHDDQLDGGLGNDLLQGGSGDDVLIGNLGNDQIHGGEGLDTATYAAAVGGVRISLAITSLQNTQGAGKDTLSGIEYLVGSGYDDILTGDSGANELNGGDGNDILGGGGGDALVGGSGEDTASYAHAVAGVRASLADAALNNGFAAADTYTSIENLTGSRYADILIGDAGANRLNGGLGADQLDGRAGNDRLSGGGGLDSLTGGTGKDTFVFDQALVAGNVTTVVDFSAADDNFVLAHAVFAAAGSAPGVLNPNAFHVGSAAHDADDRIIYNSATGNLLYDADGNGAGAAKAFATVGQGLAIAANDFTLV